MSIVWNALHNDSLGLMDSISNQVMRLELTTPGCLSSVRHCSNVLMASDYGGQNAGAKYETYSFLIADFPRLAIWNELRLDVRKRYLGDGRRMCFKKLQDKHRKSALLPFLRSADTIRGVCFTFSVEKSIESLFKEEDQSPGKTTDVHLRHEWRPRVLEKMIRIAHFSAFIVAGMTKANQELLWVSDDDVFSPTDSRFSEFCEISTNITNHYIRHKLARSRIGTINRNEDGSLFIEDFAAIPDLISGMMVHAHPEIKKRISPGLSSFAIDKTAIQNRKARNIFEWYASSNQELRKVLIRFENAGNGRIQHGCIAMPAMILAR